MSGAPKVTETCLLGRSGIILDYYTHLLGRHHWSAERLIAIALSKVTREGTTTQLDESVHLI